MLSYLIPVHLPGGSACPMVSGIHRHMFVIEAAAIEDSRASNEFEPSRPKRSKKTVPGKHKFPMHLGVLTRRPVQNEGARVGMFPLSWALISTGHKKAWDRSQATEFAVDWSDRGTQVAIVFDADRGLVAFEVNGHKYGVAIQAPELVHANVVIASFCPACHDENVSALSVVPEAAHKRNDNQQALLCVKHVRYQSLSEQAEYYSSFLSKRRARYASNVTWSHGTNSNTLFTQARASQVDMIEADVILAQAGPNKTHAVMGHPPAISSDFSFAQFLDLFTQQWVTQRCSKGSGSTDENNALQSIWQPGLKLDFKDSSIVTACLALLSALCDKDEPNEKLLKIPLWLNADIWQGPGADSCPFSATDFLALCTSFAGSDRVKCTFDVFLSVGWTTHGDWHVPSLCYTRTHLQRALSDLHLKPDGPPRNTYTSTAATPLPVTFPLRARLACAAGLGLWQWLLGQSPLLSLTVWGEAGEAEQTWLGQLCKQYPDRVFVDVKPACQVEDV